MEPCRHCPVRNATCPAIRNPHPRYCQLVDPDGPDYRPAYIRIVAEAAASPAAPSLARKAVNLGHAVAEHVADAGRLAGPEVVAERERTCKSDECGYHDPSRDSCNHADCGCNLRIKRSWASSSCPIGRWSKA
jgi:hypothetical protein